MGLSQDTSLRSDREVGHFDSSAVALPPSSTHGEGDVMRARSDVTKTTASVASAEGACVGAGAGGRVGEPGSDHFQSPLGWNLCSNSPKPP